MLFNSYFFIFLFLPILLIGWFSLNHLKKYKMAQCFLLAMSLWFYSFGHISYFFLIVGSITVNYLISFLLYLLEKKANSTNMLSKLILFFGIIFNLLLLGYYKYFDFFIENVNFLFKTNFLLKNIALPLGISFFTFQQIGFIVDRAKGEAHHHSLLDYACFVSYFPQLVAGPIISQQDLIPQFQDKEKRIFQSENFARGILLFVIGLSKKLIVADTLDMMVSRGFSDPGRLDSLSLFIVMLSYTLQIFFDFSGYCDMALGLAKMMNFDLPVNFCSPYQSKSIREFWRRWHITLNQFLTKYVYIPLGGNRNGTFRTLRNILIVFFLSGLWHGANWTFILWGVCHGIILMIETLFSNRTPDFNVLHKKSRALTFVQWIATFSFVNLAWVLFRSDSIQTAGIFFKNLLGFHWNASIIEIATSLDSSLIHLPLSIVKRINSQDYFIYGFYILYMILVLLVPCFLCTRKSSHEWALACNIRKQSIIWTMALLFVFCVISLSDTAPFLYSNF